jgi:putative thioredoxin
MMPGGIAAQGRPGADMPDQSNPYGGQGGYAATVNFGGAAAPQPGEAQAAAAVADVTTASFTKEVLQESRQRPVLVDFWAPWCGPCKQLAPVLERVVAETGGKVRLVKMNIDDHPSIAGQLGIQSIPAVIAFRNGQPVDGFMGALPESQIREFLKRITASEGADRVGEALKAAEDARQQGDTLTASEIYAAILDELPGHPEATAGIAGLLLDSGDIEQAKAVLDAVDPAKADAPAVASVRARIALAEQTAELGDPREFEARLAADPKDHDARFDLAMIQNAHGDRHGAADNLLAIVKADRTWRDDGARTQLLQFFDAWGMADEATLAARRKLSSLLFS